MHFQDKVSLCIPARSGWVTLAGGAAREYATRAGFSDADAARICLALEEAALKAIRYGYGRERDELGITCARSALGMHMWVRSAGLPLDEESLPGYDPRRVRAEGDTTGLGSFLIRSMMDKVTFSVLGQDEREIVMLKHLPLSTRGDLSGDKGMPAPGGRVNTAHTVRLARPDDADAISRLALRSHGSVLFSAQIYYPACVREMLENSEMFSVVGETPGGEIIGHAALVVHNPGDRVEELTYAFVDERFRTRGCSGDMAGLLVENATSRGTYAIKVTTVTNHTHAQRGVVLAGWKECGLFVASSPPSHVWRKDDAESLTRIGNLGLIKYLNERDDTLLFAPGKHLKMIERISENLGLRRRFADGGECVPPGSASSIATLSDLSEGWSMITVNEYGADSVSHVAAGQQLSNSQGVAVTHLLLPLDNPLTPAMCGEFEKLGFFFAGIGPDSDGRENLLLQYLNGVDPGYDSIRIYSEFGRELLEYVRSCDLNTESGG